MQVLFGCVPKILTGKEYSQYVCALSLLVEESLSHSAR